MSRFHSNEICPFQSAKRIYRLLFRERLHFLNLLRCKIAHITVVTGTVRIFNQEIQSKMFEVLGFTPEAAQEQFGFLLNAFKYGVPPHAGLAYGLDRLVMLMAKEDSIRDVSAFPKVKDASDLMTEAPAQVDVAQLEELGLELAKVEEK